MLAVAPIAIAAQRRTRRFFNRWHRDERGATALEFAMVAVPFLMLVFGIIAAGLFFFTAFSMEHAVEQASRTIRTGNFRTANEDQGMTTKQFKESVCALAPLFVDCQSKVRVSVLQVGQFSDVPANRPSCTDGDGNLALENSNDTDRVNVGASSIVLVTVCYQFDLAGMIPYLKLGQMSGPSSNDAALIQAAVTFRTEPFE